MLNTRSVLIRVLGIEPGSRILGWGVVESEGRGVRHVAHGVFRLDASAPLERRLVDLFGLLGEALALHAPTAVAVEGVFTFRNARSALVLGHARGVALLVAARANLPVFEYAPAAVKRAVGVGGAGAKEAVSRAVCGFLGLDAAPRADASDALAVAMCHPPSRRAGAAAPRRLPASPSACVLRWRVRREVGLVIAALRGTVAESPRRSGHRGTGSATGSSSPP
jgi:crossover junction endodeoxyribonuclease RuvC